MNYHHLHYFWTVVREGGVTRAAEALEVSQPTVSTQIATLEKDIGQALFTRSGRGMVLTPTGQTVYNYADEIFRLGGELEGVLRGAAGQRPRLVVGVADALPKTLVYRLLQPVLEGPDAVRLECVEDKPERLLAELALHHLDVVLTDAPAPPAVKVKAFFHLLGECGITWCAAPVLAAGLKGRFPENLSGAPVLLPAEGSAVRRALDQWMAESEVRPVVVAELADSALLKAFGQSGAGAFPIPTAIEREVTVSHGVTVLGRAERVRARFYAASVQRQLKHPAIVKVCETARQELFG